MVLITVATTPVFGQTVSGEKCQDKEGCVGYTEKILFITGMALIGLGRAARVATAEPFIADQIQTTNNVPNQPNNNSKQTTIHEEDQANNNSEQTTIHEEDQANNNSEHTTNHEPDQPNNNSKQTTIHEEDQPNNNSEQMTNHGEEQPDNRKQLSWWRETCVLMFLCTPVVVICAFPYIKKWYILFGVSASCTIFTTIFFFMGAQAYKKSPPKAERSPVTNFARVFVAAAFKITQPRPKENDPRLHCVAGEEIKKLSQTCILGFLHKAAIEVPGDRVGSWKLCSVSEVESAKDLIRLLPILSCFIMCGIVHSTANTYFVEQASHMKFNIGKWKPPLQLLLLVSGFGKFMTVGITKTNKDMLGKYGVGKNGQLFVMYSVLCCAVAAAVERRRIHVLRRHDLLDLPDDGKVPMSAGWLVFQILFSGHVEPFSEYGFSAFFEFWAPSSMKRYHDCFVEGVTGFGFLCSSFLVYAVGKVSEVRGGKSWFQYTLNRSRLDRYYWVLTVLCSLSVIAYLCLDYIYTLSDAMRSSSEDKQQTDEFIHCSTSEPERLAYLSPIIKGSAVELVLRHYKLSPPVDQYLGNVNLCAKGIFFDVV
ncbi:protein NRT1/ PTR FAMILY 5.5-like isoform X2 [Salvia hispanica]|nr:protein NRT1/ PTR FAMILY 5.5-like isoform X2 [Salvia hispanica]